MCRRRRQYGRFTNIHVSLKKSLKCFNMCTVNALKKKKNRFPLQKKENNPKITIHHFSCRLENFNSN